MAKQSIVGFNDGPETVRMTTWRPSVSVVYPMFNEEENIERAVQFAEAVLTDMTSDYEILIVNDASTDRSAEIAESLARSNRCVKVFYQERNLKLGGAFRTGFSKATKELVFYCDSDLSVGQACGCPILIATNISTCSRLYSKSLGGLPAGWIMFGFAILLAPGENRRGSEWDGGYSGLV